MDTGEKLFEAAKETLKTRYPDGAGGAAAVYTESGAVFTSVAPGVVNSATELCIETGAILEAHKYNTAVTHSLCLVRENGALKILTPCGVCQERLLYWGRDVLAAVTSNEEQPIVFKTLRELQPDHWSYAYSDDEFFA
ncbi:cytidine deaminase [Salisediminibacterium halotolerans]|uniref:Cytidine deaminase n=1 Tax=Salisediminibacterium halotolerans TaxID=517425 RepID=A0A1H9W911_9BACI|nr:cytidine deaminase [Salisediminibacterium haloalkalitolerans]SES30446.1 cytidine deaminase [Salisediminibacterium haloalkalitolerans]